MAIENVSYAAIRFAGESKRQADTRNYQVDSKEAILHNEGMSTPVTTDLLDAKLETIEAKMDARVQRIEDRCDQIDRDMQDIKSEMKSMKWWMIGTGLSVVLGIAAFNATVLSNMVASFESGKNTSAAQAQVMQQVKDTQALLDQIKKQHPAQ
jgi:lipopolysaccharide export system protein LptC